MNYEFFSPLKYIIKLKLKTYVLNKLNSHATNVFYMLQHYYIYKTLQEYVLSLIKVRKQNEFKFVRTEFPLY